MSADSGGEEDTLTEKAGAKANRGSSKEERETPQEEATSKSHGGCTKEERSFSKRKKVKRTKNLNIGHLH